VHASKPTSIQSIPSATGGIARLVCARLRESSILLNPLLSKAGLTVEQIDNRSIRLKARSQIRLLELAAGALQDDLLGFHLARDYDLREIGLLYYVLASSEILNEALHKVVRYSGIANEGVSLKFPPPRKPRFPSTTSASNVSRIITTLNFGWYRSFVCAVSSPTVDWCPVE
jgi:Arabinose-binding domain of AraC transcription regulator, N-term